MTSEKLKNCLDDLGKKLYRLSGDLNNIEKGIGYCCDKIVEVYDHLDEPRWTKQDIADLDDLLDIVPDLVSVERACCERIGDIKLWKSGGGYVWINGKGLIPSLLSGEKVDIQDILDSCRDNGQSS